MAVFSTVGGASTYKTKNYRIRAEHLAKRNGPVNNGSKKVNFTNRCWLHHPSEEGATEMQRANADFNCDRKH